MVKKIERNQRKLLADLARYQYRSDLDPQMG